MKKKPVYTFRQLNDFHVGWMGGEAPRTIVE